MNPVHWFNVTDLTRGLYLNPRAPVIDWAPVYLDYFEFSALLAWTLVLLVWWWHPHRKEATAWRWLPWAAGVGGLQMLVEFFSLQLAVFGNARAYSLPVDLIQCALWLAAAGACLWTAPGVTQHPLRWWFRALVLASALTAAGLRRDHDEGVAWFMAAFALLAALPWLRRRRAGGGARLAVLAFALGPAISTTGPFAYYAFAERRSFVPSLLEPWSASWQVIAATLALAGLVRHALATLSPEERQDLRQSSLRAYVWRAAAVVGLGLLAATILGEAEYDQAIDGSLVQVREVRAQVDTANLEKLLDGFHIEKLEPGHLQPWLKATEVRSARLDSPEAQALRATLDSILVAGAATFQEVRVVTLCDGYLVALCGKSKTPGYAGLPAVYRQWSPAYIGRPATAADRQNWQDRADVYERSFPMGSSGFTLSRVPLTAPDGRMLGWLEFVWAYHVQIAPAQRVRAVPLLATVLGVALVALFFVQSEEARARERAARRAAVEAEANRLKTAFLANVSHELRTPLQSILGHGELLQPEVTSTAGAARLDALRRQGELMVRLVNDLIDLGAAAAGSFPLSPRPVELAPIVRQTVESLRPRADARRLDLHLELPPDLPAWVAIDDGRFRQVLLNLLGNALKFTDRGGVTVTLRAEPLAGGDWRLVLAVRDTGPGIPPAQQKQLFMPFSRLAATADREGSGLGLALAAALCRAMGGDLIVESDGRNGACFTATFEAKAATASASTTARPATITSTAPRVLVVDDNRLVRELFVSALTARGAPCRAAASGTAGLADVTAEAPEVIVLDLALPDGDGVDFVPRLRSLAPRVRIIGVSAHAGVADRERALAAGMDDFLAKPVALEALWAAVVGRSEADQPSDRLFAVPAALQSRLRTAFDRELPDRRAALAAAVPARDWAAVRAGAHYLRNSALVIQDDALYAACTALEEAAETADATAVAARWRECAAILENLRA